MFKYKVKSRFWANTASSLQLRADEKRAHTRDIASRILWVSRGFCPLRRPAAVVSTRVDVYVADPSPPSSSSPSSSLFYFHRHLRLSCPLRLGLPLPTACLLPLLRLLFHRHVCVIFVFRSLLGASLSEIIIIKTTITYRGSILSSSASVFFFSSTSCPVLSITSSSKLSAYFSII